MQSISLNDERAVKLLENEEDLALLQDHLKEVIEGEAFRGSHRSGQFLKYVVEQAIARHFDSLKERVIGVELFGRPPSYDTGEDAIVRVTASDVRKRLLQHYGMYGATSRFRISLPLGSYIPEISLEPRGNVNGHHELQTSLHDAVAKSETSGSAQESTDGAAIATSTVVAPIQSGLSRLNRPLLIVIVLATAINLSVWGILWTHVKRPAVLPDTILPWSVFFSSPRPIHLITSDPDIAEVQQYIGGEISTSDYANRHLIPNPDKMAPEVQRFWNVIIRDDKASFVDAEIAVRIAEMTQAYSKRVNLSAARNIQISDLQTDDNYIFLGSPRSDPWSALFSDQLDFQFTFDQNYGQEIIRNLHPKPHEALQYVPTALGGATGQSYAIIAFVQNPDHNGQILLLAGANAEGTEAAGRLITDMPRLSTALRACGISPDGSLKHFELLLKLNTMAGSPNDAHLEACHILGGSPLHM
jgi:hypothetical protein